MNKRLLFLRFTYIILVAAIVASCSKLKKARNLLTNPSAKEIYEREFKEAPQLFGLWKEQSVKALRDSIGINLPYSEKGYFSPRSFPVYSYELTLKQGENLNVQVTTDSSEVKVFIDLFRQQEDSIRTFEHIESAEYESSELQKEISLPGIYKVLIQPEIEANTPFELQIFTEPVYVFPVVSASNSSIQSYWGATRDAGRRSHEGIDIFAARGTPVVAAVKGRVSSTGNKGLGGKQVWLRDSKRGNSLYYAHLDSIIAIPGMAVSPGDTLGFVGNTGNARTTPPHLHFGIYRGYRGAINPIGFVMETEKPERGISTVELSPKNLLLTKATANLRTGPTTSSMVLDQTKPGDTLQMLGRTKNWYHIRANNKNFFVHENLVSILK